MKINFRNLLLTVVVSTSLIYLACNKVTPENTSESSVTPANAINVSKSIEDWLRKELIKLRPDGINSSQMVATNSTTSNSGSPNKAANIEMLMNNLDYSNLVSDKMDNKNSIYVIPISDKIKGIKSLKEKSSLALMTLIDHKGSVKWARIVYFIPSVGQKEKKLSANDMRKVLLQESLDVDGVYIYLSISGTWIGQTEYRGGRFYSYGYISSKANKEKQTNLLCIDWYIITTFHMSDGSTYQTSEYVGQTCSGCDSGNYQSLCEPGETGGSTCTMSEEDALIALSSTTTDAFSRSLDFSTGSEYVDPGTGRITKPANLNPWDFAIINIHDYYTVWPLGYTAYYGAVLYKNSINDTWKWESISYQGNSRTSGTMPPCYGVDMTVTPRSNFITNNETNAASTLSYSAITNLSCLGGLLWGQPIVVNDLSVNWGLAK